MVRSIHNVGTSVFPPGQLGASASAFLFPAKTRIHLVAIAVITLLGVAPRLLTPPADAAGLDRRAQQTSLPKHDSMPAEVPVAQDTCKPAPFETVSAKHKRAGNPGAPLAVIDAGLTGWVVCLSHVTTFDPVAVRPRAMHFLVNGEHGPPALTAIVTRFRCSAPAFRFLPQQILARVQVTLNHQTNTFHIHQGSVT